MTPDTISIQRDAAQRDAFLRDQQNAVIARMRADPQKARSTIVTTGRVDAGIACTASQGKFSTVMDFGPGMGGEATGPSPGFHARAAIAGCVAMAIKMLATREGLVLETVEVSVETDFDDAALFGLGSGKASPLETRIAISIRTAEPDGRVRQIVDRALDMDPWFLALRDPQKVVPSVTVTA